MSNTKKAKTSRKTYFISGISVMIGIGLLILLSSTIWLPSLLNSPYSSYSLSPSTEKDFIDRFAKNADVNSGLNLHVQSFYSDPSSTQAGELISFDVYNNTDEPIVFQDHGFGIRLFTPEEELETWKEIMLLYIPAETTKVIGQKTETYDPITDNSFFLLYSDFEIELPEQLRFFIIGTGQLSNKKYVAFVDLLRK